MTEDIIDDKCDEHECFLAYNNLFQRTTKLQVKTVSLKLIQHINTPSHTHTTHSHIHNTHLHTLQLDIIFLLQSSRDTKHMVFKEQNVRGNALVVKGTFFSMATVAPQL